MATGTLNKHAVAVFEEQRAERGVSYRELSRRTGINTGTLSKYLAGDTSLRLDTWQALCDGLGVSYLTLLNTAQKRVDDENR